MGIGGREGSDAQGRATGIKEKGAGGEEREEAGKHKGESDLGTEVPCR